MIIDLLVLKTIVLITQILLKKSKKEFKELNDTALSLDDFSKAFIFPLTSIIARTVGILFSALPHVAVSPSDWNIAAFALILKKSASKTNLYTF